jgi:nucleotide-binding universal stress UspA family protein
MIRPLFSNIIAAISGSDESVLAAKYAIVMAKAYQCRLTAVYVVDTDTVRRLTLSKIFIQEESQEYVKNLEINGERYLSFVEELALAKGVKIEREIRHGAVYTEVLAAADDKKADLIILGGLDKERSSRDVFLNSYHGLIMNAKCSVLFAKEPAIDLLYKQA